MEKLILSGIFCTTGAVIGVGNNRSFLVAPISFSKDIFLERVIESSQLDVVVAMVYLLLRLLESFGQFYQLIKMFKQLYVRFGRFYLFALICAC